jgi:hypothetical protein
MSLKRFSLLVGLGLCVGAGWWFLSRAWRLARETSDASHAQAYLKQIDQAQKRFARDNPTRGFACQLDDLRRAGLPSSSDTKYNVELHCNKRMNLSETEYLVITYPADKRVTGAWGFRVFCSDQTGQIWSNLSREETQGSPSETEKAGVYDFERICRRNHNSSAP